MREPQLRFPHQWKVVYRNYIDFFVFGAEYSEGVDLPSIILALTSPMILRGCHRKNDGSMSYLACLALNAAKPSVVFNNQIVPKIVTKRHQNLLPTLKQSRHDLRLCDISYRFAIP